MDNQPIKHRRIYGRRQSRPLNSGRKEAIEILLPKLEISQKRIDEKGSLRPEDLFGFVPPSLWMEIGFGNGEHLAALIRRDPLGGYIGAEPFINGMAAFLKDIHEGPHDNVRVWMDDAMMVVKSLCDECLDGFYVLNPDPWPKTRHHKRRIINQDNLNQFARTLKPGGQLVMATDVDELAEWMVTEATIHPAFAWTAEQADDWRKMPADWIQTRYEQKGGKAGRKQSYLIFEKRVR